jgi:hypothetical protein
MPPALQKQHRNPETEPYCRKILYYQLSPPTSTTIGLASGTTLPGVLLAGSPRQCLAKIRPFCDKVRLQNPPQDALYPLSRSKELQQNSLHPELGISLEELGNEKDGMEAVADWPVPRLISCNPALWAGAGDWPAITEGANAVCCPPCSLGKCGDSLAICKEAPRASELKLSVAMSTTKECRKIHLAPAVVWPLGRETQRVTLGAVRSL